MTTFPWIREGVAVFWNDPDAGACSGKGKVVVCPRRATEEDIISLKMDDGGEVEALPHELEPVGMLQ